MRKKRNMLVALFATALAAVLFVGWLHTDFKAVAKSGFAMGTVVTAKLYGGSEDDAAAVLASVTALENEISRNIDTTAVSVLNRTGRAESEVLADAVTACRAVSAASDGAFDITVGALTKLWDFDGGGVLPDAGDIESALPYIDYNRLTVDGDTITADAGTQIDLGAVGKGAACDAVRDVLAARGVSGAVVDMRNCYNTGSVTVTGVAFVGGISGYADPWDNKVINNYNTGKVKASTKGTFKGQVIGGYEGAEMVKKRNIYDNYYTGSGKAYGWGFVTWHKWVAKASKVSSIKAANCPKLSSKYWTYSSKYGRMILKNNKEK